MNLSLTLIIFHVLCTSTIADPQDADDEHGGNDLFQAERQSGFRKKLKKIFQFGKTSPYTHKLRLMDPSLYPIYQRTVTYWKLATTKACPECREGFFKKGASVMNKIWGGIKKAASGVKTYGKSIPARIKTIPAYIKNLPGKLKRRIQERRRTKGVLDYDTWPSTKPWTGIVRDRLKHLTPPIGRKSWDDYDEEETRTTY